MSARISRRGFLSASSAGLLLGFSLSASASAESPIVVVGAQPTAEPHPLSAWIHIGEDDVVTLFMGAAEMGQGVFTALPMILAEELDADWARVRAISAPTHKDYRRQTPSAPIKVQLTGGSESVRGYWTILRKAGASARQMLIAAAAAQWGVSASTCHTEAGAVRCADRIARYGELAAAAALHKPPRKVTLKSPADFRILGTSPARLDLPDKVNGKATFGIDIRREDLRYAAMKACPHHGGSLVSFRDDAALLSPGVEDIFQIDEAVVVIADSFWRAKQALAKVEITWDPGAGAGLDSAAVSRRLQEAMDAGGKTVFTHDDKHSDKPQQTTFTATYAVPYLAHAPIEPINATAHVQADRVDIWAPTQAQTMTQSSAAKITGVPRSKVAVHDTLLGGGFGRKSFTDFTDYAVKIAMKVPGPVKLVWTREECFAHGFYRPACLCRQSAALGADGLPTDWYVEMASQHILQGILPTVLLNIELAVNTVVEGMSQAPYAIAHQRVDYARVELPVPVGWWRSVHASHNGFFRESFIDELAHEAGQDPIAYRRALLVNSPRYAAVFALAVAQAGDVPEGQHRGVALMESFGSIVAHVADVTVEDGEVRVHRVTAAIDCGIALHPDTIKAQVQGAVGMGLSMTLGGGLSLVDGAVQEDNYHRYPVLTLRQMPAVDVHIVPSAEPPGGVGEVGLPPIAPAVCNAIFHATGIRIRTLPIGDQLKTT